MTKFEYDDIVWVQVTGFPWWPAKVVNPSPSVVSEEIIQGKSSPKEDVLVRFFCSDEYSWTESSNSNSIRLFSESMDLLKQAKVKSNSALRKAVNAAKKEYEQISGEKLSDGEEEDDDNKKGSKKNSTTSTTSGKKRKKESSADEDYDEDSSAKKKDDKKKKSTKKEKVADQDVNEDEYNEKPKKKAKLESGTSTTSTSKNRKEEKASPVDKGTTAKREDSKTPTKKTSSAPKKDTDKTPSEKSSSKASSDKSSASEKTTPKVKPLRQVKKTSDKKAEKIDSSSNTVAKKKQVVLSDEELEQCNAKLDRYINEANDEKIREVVTFLHDECEPVTVAQLGKIKIGRTMNKLKKHSESKIARYSSNLVNKWKQLVIGSQNQTNNNSNSKSTTPTTPTTPQRPVIPSGPTVDESLIETTNDKMRDFARKKFANGLATGTSNHKKCGSLATMIEQAMFEHFGKDSNSDGYKQQLRSVSYNLSDPNNPDFCQMVLLGEFTPGKIATLTSKEMASNELKAERERIQQEATRESMTAQPAQTKTSMFTCRRCKSQNCTYYQMQTRSADEPMTVFVTCLNCDSRWKC